MKFGGSRLSSVSVMAAPKRFCNFDFFCFSLNLPSFFRVNAPKEKLPSRFLKQIFYKPNVFLGIIVTTLEGKDLLLQLTCCQSILLHW